MEDLENVPWKDKADIVVNIDGLMLGEYTYKIEVTDHDSNDEPLLTAIDEVIVTVVMELPSSTNTEEDSSDDSNLPFPFLSILIGIIFFSMILRNIGIRGHESQ